jgi:hypothetical protein
VQESFGAKTSALMPLQVFNYDFVVNDKVINSGVEHWQVCKIDGQWKILSLTWTSYDRS